MRLTRLRAEARSQRGPQGPPGSEAQFNGAAAGGSLTGTAETLVAHAICLAE